MTSNYDRVVTILPTSWSFILYDFRHCGREIGATQYVVWSRAPGQIFLCSESWRVTVFQRRLYITSRQTRHEGVIRFFTKSTATCYYYYYYFLSSTILLGILKGMSVYSPAILQKELLGRFSAFLLFFYMSSGGCTLPI
jgi:hypothetical protein